MNTIRKQREIISPMLAISLFFPAFFAQHLAEAESLKQLNNSPAAKERSKPGDAGGETMKIAVLKGYYRAPRVLFMNRLRELNISADCLPHEELFDEKHLFLYDAFVAPPGAALEKHHFDDLITFVSKGGLFISFTTGGAYIDWDGSRGYGSPPDMLVCTRKGGEFYELTGGALIPQSWGGCRLKEFTVLQESPITEGFQTGEQLQTDVTGIWAEYPADGTIVLCGNATLLSGETERTKNGNVIQVKKYGQGASIWIAAELHKCDTLWADRLLTNIFSRKTLKWLRQLP